MEEVKNKKICHQTGCKILEGGSCLESIDVTKDECPHFYADDDTTRGEETKLPNNEKPGVGIRLYTGKEMTFAETSLVTNRYDSKLIAIIGESKSGKTTLLAEYFINFQKAPFGDYFYAGSLTQIGFEERCFYATVGSKAKRPDTGRTKSKEFSFLHLALKTKNKLSDDPVHFLISDISGERFREAKVSSAQMQELKILRAADFILFIIDGEKLADKSTRAVTIEDAKTFIQKALDERIFDKATKLKVAISKWDYLHSDASFSFDDKIVKAFTDRFASRLATLEFTQLAARSNHNSVKAGTGLHELLKGWEMDDNNAVKAVGMVQHNSDRAFHKYSTPNL